MRGVFNIPVRADGPRGPSGGDRAVRDVEGGFACRVEQPGCGVTCRDRAFHPDDRGDVGMPIGVGECGGRIKDSDEAGFIAIAAMIAALCAIVRGGRRGQAFNRGFQGRLIVLDLNDQADFGFLGDLEEFF